MRRTYISPEYVGYKVYGTFNMVEESNFFGSKMLEVEDNISIGNSDIIYYQNLKGEQLDFSIESSIQSHIYSSSESKKRNHTLEFDDKQPNSQKEKNTKWILTIQLKQILQEYLYAEIKKWRTFEGIRNEMTRYSDVNVAINNYIDFNVLNRYKLETIDFYINYKDLRNQNILRYKNTWDSTVVNDNNKMTKLQRETSIDSSIVKLIFTQEKPSSDWTFNYFFNLNFVKV